MIMANNNLCDCGCEKALEEEETKYYCYTCQLQGKRYIIINCGYIVIQCNF